MRLAAKAYPAITAGREPWIICQFLEGLGSEAAKIHVGLQKPQTLQEAMQLAAEFEALAQTHGASRPTAVKAVGQDSCQDLQAKMELLQRKITQLKSRNTRPPSHTSRGVKTGMARVERFTCHKKGHYARDRPEKGNSPTQTSPSEHRKTAITANLRTPSSTAQMGEEDHLN